MAETRTERVADLLRQGLRAADIAPRCGVSLRYVYAVAHRYRIVGIVRRGPVPGSLCCRPSPMREAVAPTTTNPYDDPRWCAAVGIDDEDARQTKRRTAAALQRRMWGGAA